ncbi:MAG: carboxypeptidase regulatory-like domain-containing protein [bacterium]
MAELQSDNYLLKYSDSFKVGSQEELVANLNLDQVVVDNTGGVKGEVLDNTGTPVANATVKLFDLNFNPIKHTVTDDDGNYIITNVPQGDYLVYAVKDDYSLSLKQPVNISNGIETLPSIIITPYSTVAMGTVYGHTYDLNNNPLGGVKVNLYRESDDTLLFSTISADDGEYVIYGITQDTYTLQASNEDYVLQTPYTLNIAGKVPLNQDVYLKKINDFKEGTINGVITDTTTKAKIAGAFVGLYSIVEGNEVLIAGTITDFEGRYFFGYVPEGEYIVKAKSCQTKTF